MQYSEYPPDPNRGYDIGSAWLKVSKLGNDLIYSKNVLMSLPNPDFSMPYNVITLTSTVIAFYFGSLFNLMTRSFKDKRKTKSGGLKGLLERVI